MKKNLIVRQVGYRECGIACLLSIIRYYGGNVSINKLSELTHTNKFGTSFYNLKMAALYFGLESEAYKFDNKSIECLKDIIKPSICQIIDNNYEHFVVLYEINDKYITIMDPAHGKQKIPVSDFLKVWTGYCISFIKTRSIPYLKEEKYLNKVIIGLIKKNKCIVLNIVLLSIFFTVCSSLYAMYSGIIIDYFLLTSKYNLFVITVVFLVILIIKSFVSFFRNKLLIFLNQKLDYSIFLSSFEKILLLPYSYYKNRTVGEVITRINDLDYVKNMLSKIILTLFLDLIISVVCAVILFRINFFMFILLLVTILGYVIIFLLFRPIIKKYTDINQENNAKVNSLMIEMINGYETIKNLNLEYLMNKKMTSLYINSLKTMFSYDSINNLELFFKDFLTYFSILIVEFVGFIFVCDNILTTGQIVIFVSLISYFINPIRDILDLNSEYFYAMNSLRRANTILDVESTDLSNKTNFVIQGKIKINNLSYSYNGYKNILNKVDISIDKGEKVLILGESGSGKSTIIKLLAKYYFPENGRILLDDIDINDICISNLKKYLILVSQDEIIFTDTIKNNIILNRNIDDNDFIDMCKLLYVDDFVSNMYLGYNTQLEENGKNLSGGQRQRIILARSLLKNGNIILLDESLNAVDVNLERKILKNIFLKFNDKSIIIVSHRLENMDLFDKVIRFDDGHVNSIKKVNNDTI